MLIRQDDDFPTLPLEGDHLSREVLEAYRTGRLSDEALQRLAPHVDSCEVCQARLDQPDSELAELALHAAPLPPKIPRYDYVLGSDRFPVVIGRGGLGIVFLAKFRGLLGSPVRAVKLLHTGQQIDARGRERFLREMEAITGLAGQANHGFVQVYECGETRRGCLYYIMEYVRGGDLHKRLQQQLPEPTQAARWLLELAATMEVAHRNGIFHRDLKPGNVLLETAEHDDSVLPAVVKLKIADFSHVRLMEKASDLSQNEPVGTPNYMSPEQTRGLPVDARADVYGLCAILYEMLTGQPPYSGANPQATMEMVRSQTIFPTPPATLEPVLGYRTYRDLVSICMKGLEKEAQDRYGTVHELVEDLQRYLQGKPTKARPIRWPEQTIRHCRRHPRVVALAASLVLVCCAALAGIVYQWKEATRLRYLAEDGQQQILQMVTQIIAASRPVSVRSRTFVPDAGPELLASAERKCRQLLQKQPDNIKLRISLTRVLAGLADVYEDQCRLEIAHASLEKARLLWKPLIEKEPENPAYRIWYALTLAWCGTAHTGHGHYDQGLEESLLAESLWLSPGQEHFNNRMLIEQYLENAKNLFNAITTAAARAQFREPLENRQARLEKSVHDAPANRVLRQDLAFNSLLLGELHYYSRANLDLATKYWNQAAEHYLLLRQERPNVLIDLPLAQACMRLIPQGAKWYDQALIANQRAAAHLQRLSQDEAHSSGLQQFLLQARFATSLCHWFSGASAIGDDNFRTHLEYLDRLLERPDFEIIEKVWLLEPMLDAAVRLREANQFETGLTIVMEAATRMSKLSKSAIRDREATAALAAKLHCLGTLHAQMGEPGNAVPLFNQSRRLFQRLTALMPNNINYAHGLGDALAGLGKAYARLDDADHSLSAFREAVTKQRKLFERFPDVPVQRLHLSRSYDRLHAFSLKFGRRSEAADALRERAKLWPNNESEIRRVAHDFFDLAKRVGDPGQELTVSEQSEQTAYLEAYKMFDREAVRLSKAAPKPTSALQVADH
jgi:tetratricopeptide (TPR) repeat protein